MLECVNELGRFLDCDGRRYGRRGLVLPSGNLVCVNFLCLNDFLRKSQSTNPAAGRGLAVGAGLGMAFSGLTVRSDARIRFRMNILSAQFHKGSISTISVETRLV